LKNLTSINNRLDVVECFINNPELKEKIEDYVREIGDLEELFQKLLFNVSIQER
jgi:DNA mismatch repair protein MutS